MKKIGEIILGIWCALASFISPIWLTMMMLDLTGEIYKYDYSADEGVAVILGAASLVVWVLAVLFPVILFLKKMYHRKRKYFFCALVFITALAVICTAMCGWNVVRFLTVPGGMKFGF